MVYDYRGALHRGHAKVVCSRCGSTALVTATDIVRGWRLGYCRSCGAGAATRLGQECSRESIETHTVPTASDQQ
jgi:hypothetical protein